SVRYRLYSRFACRYDTPTFSLTSPRTTRSSTAPRSNSFRLIDVRSIPPSVRGNGEPRRGRFYPRLEGTLSTAYNTTPGLPDGNRDERDGVRSPTSRRNSAIQPPPACARRALLAIIFGAPHRPE